MLQPAPAKTAARDGLIDTMVGFLREIGLEVRFAPLASPTFLPGLLVDGGVLVVDRDRLTYPGDLLHEGGHLAVRSPRRRRAAHGNLDSDGGEEMSAIAWSYAAAVHLGIDLAVLFHPDGYRGASASHSDNFSGGFYFGVAPLARLDLTTEPHRAREDGGVPYPAMRAWLNDGVLDDV